MQQKLRQKPFIEQWKWSNSEIIEYRARKYKPLFWSIDPSVCRSVSQSLIARRTRLMVIGFVIFCFTKRTVFFLNRAKLFRGCLHWKKVQSLHPLQPKRLMLETWNFAWIILGSIFVGSLRQFLIRRPLIEVLGGSGVPTGGQKSQKNFSPILIFFDAPI